MQIEIGRVFTVGYGRTRRTAEKGDQGTTYEFLVTEHVTSLDVGA
jgi:hypothetical protein